MVLLSPSLQPRLNGFGLMRALADSSMHDGHAYRLCGADGTAVGETGGDRGLKGADVYSLARTLIFAATAAVPRIVAGHVQQRMPRMPEAVAPLLEKMLSVVAGGPRRRLDLISMAAEFDEMAQEYGTRPVRPPRSFFHPLP